MCQNRIDMGPVLAHCVMLIRVQLTHYGISGIDTHTAGDAGEI